MTHHHKTKGSIDIPSILLLFCLFFSLTQCLEIGDSNHIKLSSQNKFEFNETIIVTQEKLDAFRNENNMTNKEKWFVFLDIEPSSEITWPDIYLTIYTRDLKDKTKIKHKKECAKQGLQIETCYISSEQFDYKEQELILSISTDEEASILLETELILMKNLELNSCNRIDSSSLTRKDSKLFKINVSEIVVPYEQIRITLTPMNKIFSGEALNMYATIGKFYPTSEMHQKSSHYAWEMGVSMIFFKAELTEANEIYLLLDYPQNYLFDLDITLIEDYKQSVELKTGEFNNDALSGPNYERVYIITVTNLELSNYVRIKNYFGEIFISSTKVVEYVPGHQNNANMTYLKEFLFERYLDSSKFKIDNGIKKLQIKLGIFTHFQAAFFTIQTYQNSKNYNWINDGQTHMSELIQNQKSYFVSRVVRHKSQILESSEAQLHIFTKKGAISQRMFVCFEDDVDKCVDSVKNHTTQKQKIFVQGVVQEITSIKKILDEVAEAKKITLELGKALFINYTDQYKQLIVLIEVAGQKQYEENIFSIEFINVGIMDTISEHQSLQDTIPKGEFKIYRFTMLNDSSIKSFVFHITNLYGLVEWFATTQNPAGKSQQQLQKLMKKQLAHYYRLYENSAEVTTVEPLQTYYLVIFAIQKSMIRVKVQLKKTMTHPVDETNMTYSFVYINSLSTLDFIFEPNQLIVFDLSKTNLTVVFVHGTASLPLDSCIIFQNRSDPKSKQIPIEPKCTVREKIGKRFQTSMDVRLINYKFSVYNGNNESVPLTMTFENLASCGYRSIGQKQLFHARIFKQLGQKEFCIKYFVYRKGPLLISAKALNPEFKNAIKYKFSIGSGDSKKLTNEETIIQSSDVDEGCKGSYDSCIATLTLTINEEQEHEKKSFRNQRFLYEVQYIDEPIDLIDGSPFSFAGRIKNGVSMNFKYEIYNVNKQLTVILENRRGFFHILAKVLPIGERHVYPTIEEHEKQLSSNKTINQSKVYQTTNELFYLYQTLTISKDDILQQCNINLTTLTPENFRRSCILLISVYPATSSEFRRQDEELRFNIEIVQHTSFLKERHVTPGFVEPSTLNFYQIENNLQNSTLIIYINTNALNQQSGPTFCLDAFARFGIEEKATSENSKYHFERGSSQIIIANASKGTYSLTVRGIETTLKLCEYTIQYSVVPPSKESDTIIIPMKTLKKSTPANIKMSQTPGKNVQYFFFFNDGRKINFKILTLFEKLGEVLISVMPLATDEIQKKILTNIPTVDTLFKAEWKDSNSLEIKSQQKAYCSDCMYLIKVECIKEMEGKLIIPEEGTEITIKSNSMLYDEMLKGQKSFYRVYTDSHLAFKLNVISGEINLKIVGRKLKNVKFEKNYTSSGEEKIEVVQLQNNQTYEYYRNQVIEVQCLKDTHFLFGFIRDYNASKQNSSDTTDPNKNQSNYVEEWIKRPQALTYGVPHTVFITPQYDQCVTGPIQEDPVFIISINPYLSQSLSMENLKYDFSLNFIQNKTKMPIPESNLDVKMTSKSKIIKLIDTKEIAKYNQSQASFLICFKNSQKISIDVIQSSHVNYLAPNTEIIVQESMNLTFMSDGDNIIEVNECSGRSLVSVSRDFGSVHSLKSEIPQIRKGNSLIEFRRKGPIYLSVETSGLMAISWRDVDLEQGKNVGYHMYEPSSFRIIPNSDKNKNMTLKISPLNEVDSLKNLSNEKRPTIQSLTFEIFVQKEQQELYQAMNCHKEGGLESFQQKDFNDVEDEHYNLEFYTEKQIQEKFPEANYVLVAVKVILEMKNQVSGEKEQYRFFYPYQELIILAEDEDVSQKVSKNITEQPQNQDASTKISLENLLIVVGILIVVATLVVCQFKQIRRFVRKLTGKDRVPAENHFELRTEMASASDSFYEKARQ